MANKLTLQTIFAAVDKLSGPSRTMSRNVGKSTDSMSAGFKKMGGAVKLAVAALTTGAIAKTIGDFASRGDDIERNAGIIGLTTEAYQELSFAAKLADVEQETFAASAKKLSKNLGEMNLKTGTLYTTLAKLNPALAVQLHHAKSNDEAFSILADAISRETNAQKKALIATTAFGRTGYDLIPMFEGLAAARKKARDSGAVMTDEEVAAGAALDDALKRVKISGTGLINSALAPIAEKLTPIVERVTAWATANRELIGQKVEDTFTTAAAALRLLSDGWTSGAIPAILAGVVAYKAITGATAAWKTVTTAAAIAQKVLNITMKASTLGLIIVGISLLVFGIIQLVKHWDVVVLAFKAGWEVVKGLGQGIMEYLLMPVNLVMDAIGGLLSMLSKIPGVGDKLKSAMDALNGFQDKMNRSLTGEGGTYDIGSVVNNTKTNASAAWNGGIPVSSNTTTTNRSQLDVNFNSLPAGTSTRQTGSAPGINVNTGRQMAGFRGL